MSSSKYLLPVVIATACSSCATNDAATTANDKKLGDLEATSAIHVDKTRQLDQVDNEQVIESLKSYVEVAKDPASKQAALLRLADREAEAGADLDISGEMLVAEQAKNDERYFNFSIKQYEEQLRTNPDAPNNDEVLYQLSKAYDFKGEQKSSLKALNELVTKYPESVYTEEAQFRRGELLFTLKEYDDAAGAYEVVIERFPNSKYFFHSRYMTGWCLFKMGEYDNAFKYFTDILEMTFAGGKQYDKLDTATQKMIDDTLRVMSITTAYLDGAKTLTDYFNKLGRRSYEYLVFDRLAGHYLEKGRYKDSADSYYSYIENNPEDLRGPDMYVKMVEAYEQGGFPAQVINEKEKFAIRYGIHSDFWMMQTEAMHEHLKPVLVAYLDSTAKHYHAMAQLPKYAETHEVLNKKAAQYYQEKLETQNAKDGDPKTYFLMAETLFDAKDYEKALMMYEKVAYGMANKPFKKKDAAGHGALLCYTQLVNGAKDAAIKADWAAKRAEGVNLFVKTFPKDRKVSGVMLLVASDFYEAKSYELAVKAGQDLIAWQYRSKSDELNARKVVAHSQYELKQYSDAEQSYLQVVQLEKRGSKEHKDMMELYAASIYKQGETKLAANDVNGAIADYTRILTAAPATAIRVNAQYDAASLYIKENNWTEALKLLNDFRRRFPSHELTKEVPGKILAGYEATEQWGKAADELLELARTTKDKEKKREAIFQSIDYLEKAGNDDRTISVCKDYLKNYPRPFELAMEVRSKLAKTYGNKGDGSSQRWWLKEIIKTNDSSSEQTVRTRYLAAEASMFFADEEFDKYAKIKLTQPLKRSMATKRKALDAAMKSYEKTASYEVAEYTTAATYKIGEIYSNLAKALIDSERPRGLSEMELEQYAMLLEEEAYTFEELAIEVHQNNAARTTSGIYDDWVKKSLSSLASLVPGRYNKAVKREGFSHEIR